MRGHRHGFRSGGAAEEPTNYIHGGLTTRADGFSLLPCIGNLAFIQSNRTGDTRTIRLWKLLAVAPCWIIYNLHVRSYFGAVSESIGICTAAGALLYARHRTSNTKSAQEEHYHGDI